jgi:peptide/nickel transport system ATP-binding protein
MMNSSILLEINNLSVSYPLAKQEDEDDAVDFFALKNISITVNAGQIVGVVGESGAGKSTIGKAILGLLDPRAVVNSGQILMQNKDLLSSTESALETLRGRQIGYIYQNPMTALNPVLTIGEQVIEAIEANTDMAGAKAKAYAIKLLQQADVSMAEDRLSKYPHQLSGGLCQRIVFAIAIAAKPQLIIADEPTTALDVTVQKSVLETLLKLSRRNNVAVILITHDMGVVAEMCEYLYVLRHGQHVEQAPTATLINHPKHAYSQALMASVPRIEKRIERFVLPQAEQATIANAALEYLLDKQVDTDVAEVPVLEVKRLAKIFTTPASLFKPKQDFCAVKDVSFQVHKGETVGIVGESGSGKSTIGRLILGLHEITEGQVIYRGQNLATLTDPKDRRDLCLSMQCIFQDPYSSLNPRMTAGENITYGLKVHGLIGAHQAKRLAQDLMQLVGLQPLDSDKMPNAFSGGERQRIGIARALGYKPDFIFCDEPTSALDVSVQAELLNLLKDLQQQLDLTLLFVSHDLAVIRQMCDRVIVMKDGEALEQGDNDAIFEQPQHPYTKQLLSSMPRLTQLQ